MHFTARTRSKKVRRDPSLHHDCPGVADQRAMSSVDRRQPEAAQQSARYAPRSRIGLAVSCAGFSTVSFGVAVFSAADRNGGFSSLSLVATVLMIAFLPRCIAPRPSWLRAEVPPAPAAGLYVAAGAAALLGFAVADTTGAPGWSAVGGVVAALSSIGALVVPRQRE